MKDKELTHPTVNDTTKYSTNQDGNVFYYTFKTNAVCTKCKYADELIWEYKPEKAAKGFPTGISFHIDLYMVFVQFANSIELYSFKQGKFFFMSEHELGGFSASDFSFRVMDRSVPESPKTVETKLLGHNQGYQFEYEFSDNFDLLEVLHRGVVLWNRSWLASGDKSPSFLHINLFTKMVVIDFKEFFLVYKCSANHCNFDLRSTLADFKLDDLKFWRHDDVKRFPHLLGSDDYGVTPYGDGFTYAFTFGQENCTSVTYKHENVWSKQEHGGPSPRSAYLNLRIKVLLLESDTSFRVYTFTDSWRLIFEHAPVVPPSVKAVTPDAALRATVPAPAAKAAEPAPETKDKEKKKPSINKRTLKYTLIGCGVALLFLVIGLFAYYLKF